LLCFYILSEGRRKKKEERRRRRRRRKKKKEEGRSMSLRIRRMRAGHVTPVSHLSARIPRDLCPIAGLQRKKKWARKKFQF
jgi:hypothetical protein